MKNKLDIKILSYFFVIFFLMLLYRYFDFFIETTLMLVSVTKPLLFGGLMAYLLNLIVVRLERSVLKRLKERFFLLTRAISMITSIFIVGLVLYLIIKLIVPQLITMLTSLVGGIPVLVKQVETLIENNDMEFLITFLGDNLTTDFNNLSQRVLNFATNSVNQLLSSFVQVVGGATSGLFSFVIAFSFAIYILLSKEKLMKQMATVGQAFLPVKVYNQLAALFTIIHQTFSSFFVGQGLEAIILGTLCIIGMTIFRFPFALTIGTFIGFTALIPMFGALIGAGIGFLLIASQNFTQALLFLLFIIILQQLENNLIYPRVVGTSIGIPGIWVLVAITIGGGVGGIAGMLLGVPVVATLYQIVRILTYKKLENESLGLEENT